MKKKRQEDQKLRMRIVREQRQKTVNGNKSEGLVGETQLGLNR